MCENRARTRLSLLLSTAVEAECYFIVVFICLFKCNSCTNISLSHLDWQPPLLYYASTALPFAVHQALMSVHVCVCLLVFFFIAALLWSMPTSLARSFATSCSHCTICAGPFPLYVSMCVYCLLLHTYHKRAFCVCINISILYVWVPSSSHLVHTSQSLTSTHADTKKDAALRIEALVLFHFSREPCVHV